MSRIRHMKILFLSVFRHFFEFWIFLKYIRNEKILENKEHIILASNWLLETQSNNNGDGGGYSRGYYLYKTNGWDRSYIETTGYIIPTMLDVYKFTNDEKYFESAYKAGIWLLSIQRENGSFTDIDECKELAFDTGQVLYGLISLFESDKISQNDKNMFKKAINKASFWLCNVQDDDGSWTAYGFNGISHSYYSRVASILYKAGIVLQNDTFKSCATKNIQWVLSCIQKNGFFDKLRFSDNEENLLHAIVYVLEGLYDYYTYTKDKKVLNALLNNANTFKDINIKKDLLLGAQYDNDFINVNKERCITGLAQWSGLCFKLYKLTNDDEYLLCARKTLYYLKSKQFQEGKNLKGSLPGSVPFWGVYAPFSAVNWGVKFFLDALLLNEEYKLSLIDDSSLWIGECFRFNNDVVDEKINSTAITYISYLDEYISKSDKILDLGCGVGKYINFFKNKFHDKDIFGTDPCYFNNDKILCGSAYKIPFNFKFNLIYSIEALQHVKYIDLALEEIKNKICSGGYLIICDRNIKCLIGLLKPILEFRNKWMYPFDSPFLEKWYCEKQWKIMLFKHGFIVEKQINFYSSGGGVREFI